MYYHNTWQYIQLVFLQKFKLASEKLQPNIYIKYLKIAYRKNFMYYRGASGIKRKLLKGEGYR